MPRIIVTSRYLKSGAAKQITNYVKYIAIRPGSVSVSSNSANAPASDKQKALLLSLLKEFPETKETISYQEFLAQPTMKNASELISEIVEHNADRIITRQRYVSYLATRPGAVQYGAHGLFAQEIAGHPGNVWTHVISLRRADAQQMGYDTLEAWRGLVRRQMPNIAKQSKIDLAHLKWYAAFHDKETNPHVHIIVYSTDPKEGFLTNQGIEKIRSGFANDIYADEQHHLFAQQTDVRNQLKHASGELMKQLAEELQYSAIEDAEVMRLVMKLSSQLASAKGKKQYGYLKPEVKQTVDAIYARLALEPHICEMYKLWCDLEQTKHDMYSSAKVNFLAMQDNPTFRSVKNQIVKAVAEMKLTMPQPLESSYVLGQMDANGEAIPQEVEIDYSKLVECIEKGDQTVAYQLAKFLLKDGEYYASRRAVQLLESASAELHWASFLLGRVYLSGADGVPPDQEMAAEWFAKSAEDGNPYAQEWLDHLEAYEQKVLADTVFGLLLYLGSVLEERYDRGVKHLQADSKLRRMIQRKKRELGIMDEPEQGQKM